MALRRVKILRCLQSLALAHLASGQHASMTLDVTYMLRILLQALWLSCSITNTISPVSAFQWAFA